MAKKLTWEVEKTSLVLKVTDGAKETTWKLRKNMTQTDHIVTFGQILEALLDNSTPMTIGRAEYKPMIESVRTVDAEELAELRSISTSEITEEASKEALNARVGQLKANAHWMDADDDDIYTVEIPDYDSGEVRPR